jgi:hypothetical protein
VHPVTGSAARARRHLLRHRLVVFGPNTGQIVRYSGGWLFDRMMAGWDVTAVVADHPDTRALEILGATVVDLEAAMSAPVRGPLPQLVAIDMSLCESDRRIRDGVRSMRQRRAVDLWLWGENDNDSDPGLSIVQHRLSLAAKAFKARALAATPDCGGPVDGVERFMCSEILAPPSRSA